MTTSIPSEKDVTAEISVVQAREWLLLLNTPLAPGDCLRRAATLSAEHQETRNVLRNLDSATAPREMFDKYLDYRRYAKGSILGALRGVKELGLRQAYISTVKANAALYLGMLRAAENDPQVALKVAEQAIASRNLTREMFAAHSARAYAELKDSVKRTMGLDAVKTGAKKILGSPVKAKPSLDSLVRKITTTPLDQLSDDEKVKVLERVIEQSGKAGSLSTVWKTLNSVAKPLQLTIDLLMIAEDAKYARDPVRTVASGALRIGTALAVTTLTESAVVSVVGVLAIGSGWGVVVFFGGMAVNHYLNDWVNSTVMGIYDQFNPRISEVLRDVSWEPENFSISMQAPLPSSSMVEDIKTSLIEAA